jgi:hypothetical protein
MKADNPNFMSVVKLDEVANWLHRAKQALEENLYASAVGYLASAQSDLAKAQVDITHCWVRKVRAKND